jgi:hypothetical protein
MRARANWMFALGHERSRDSEAKWARRRPPLPGILPSRGVRPSWPSQRQRAKDPFLEFMSLERVTAVLIEAEATTSFRLAGLISIHQFRHPIEAGEETRHLDT